MTGYCRSPAEAPRGPSPTSSIASSQSQTMLTPGRHLSDAEKLRKVLTELIDTERTYVKVGVYGRRRAVTGLSLGCHLDSTKLALGRY